MSVADFLVGVFAWERIHTRRAAALRDAERARRQYEELGEQLPRDIDRDSPEALRRFQDIISMTEAFIVDDWLRTKEASDHATDCHDDVAFEAVWADWARRAVPNLLARNSDLARMSDLRLATEAANLVSLARDSLNLYLTGALRILDGDTEGGLNLVGDGADSWRRLQELIS